MRAPYSYKRNTRKGGPPPGLINSLFLACVYGYFALKMNNDPMDCFANDTSDSAIDDNDTAGMKTASNVGGTFHMSF